jgi:ribosome-associated toxin RatA of RatAB toxin-antitoxin module
MKEKSSIVIKGYEDGVSFESHGHFTDYERMVRIAMESDAAFRAAVYSAIMDTFNELTEDALIAAFDQAAEEMAKQQQERSN